MTKEEMKIRTKKYSLRIILLFRSLPRAMDAQIMGKQLLRCGTSVGANYRAACRSRSDAEFIAKLGIVEEEADECLYWMELLVESGIVQSEMLQALIKEGDEILSIVISSIKTKKSNIRPEIRNH